MTRRRSVSSILGNQKKNERRRSFQKPRKRKKVPCYCNNYESSEDEALSIIQETSEQDITENIELPQVNVDVHQTSTSGSDFGGYTESQRLQIPGDIDVNCSFLPRRRVRYTSHPMPQSTSLNIESDVYNTSEQNTEMSLGSESNNESYNEIFEDYSPPPYQANMDAEENPIDDKFSWILLWIMNYRITYNIPETATESLIKFIKIVLNEIGGENFRTFPDSLYLAKKVLGLKDRFQRFVPCTKCHKLYNKQDVENFRQNKSLLVMKCHHIEFPNSVQAESIYPFAGFRQQLSDMFCRPEFEKSLQHWANRSNSDNILSDIYDGRIWKEFKDTNNDDSLNFFRNEVADSHLGLMLNVDWFQPFDGTNHSTGAIYTVICNLPHNIRFKRENLLLLGMLLGKKIRAALIMVSCDIPAARKICGHVSALVSCHRCQKKANYENHQHNFAGMGDMEDWFVARDSNEHLQNALSWRWCNSDASRKRFVKQTGVRWSELLRLPYFDPIHFTIIDLMHCLFLDIAKWIVKRIWVDQGILTSSMLNEVQKQMNRFQVPVDLGRIPGKIDCGEGFSNFTADQWRNFFTIYATVSLWDHLSAEDRKILTHFVRICSILVSQIIESDMLQEAHRRLVKIIKLIEVQYGRNKITPNLHLSLHLSECCHDFSPLYAFWCFSFERMNGILGSLPNSNRKIEPELMHRLMNDNRIRDIITSSAQMKSLELLENHPTVGLLSENDQFASDEMERFWLNSKNIQESTVTGCEAFPGEMLRPTSENVVLSQSMLDLMIDYYIATYEMYNFRKPSDAIEQDAITIRVKMDKFGRCRIGSEVFGSALSFRHIKSSYVLAKFITTDGEVDRNPGQVQYYFKHEIDLPNGPTEHYLAFISIDDTEEMETCNVELWKTDFFPESRDCIIPVHNILCRFVPAKYKISSNRNATEYLAINPLNRKFHIRSTKNRSKIDQLIYAKIFLNFVISRMCDESRDDDDELLTKAINSTAKKSGKDFKGVAERNFPRQTVLRSSRSVLKVLKGLNSGKI
ncbi:hypothetical protein GLOIN_2v1883106 [Rhizophagus irregularis DAOM 181602=DAOM 197198]|nr:hypothetical protein GLOIN_2v1883106 [Rhizophagus irregularis DAOM 181602=DAOM 197198]